MLSLACRGTWVKYELQQWVMPTGGCVCTGETQRIVIMIVVNMAMLHHCAQKHAERPELTSLQTAMSRSEVNYRLGNSRKVGISDTGGFEVLLAQRYAAQAYVVCLTVVTT